MPTGISRGLGISNWGHLSPCKNKQKEENYIKLLLVMFCHHKMITHHILMHKQAYQFTRMHSLTIILTWLTSECLMIRSSSTDSTLSLHVWSWMFHWQPHLLVTHAMHLQNTTHNRPIRKKSWMEYTFFKSCLILTEYSLFFSPRLHSCRTQTHRMPLQFRHSLWFSLALPQNLHTCIHESNGLLGISNS